MREAYGEINSAHCPIFRQIQMTMPAVTVFNSEPTDSIHLKVTSKLIYYKNNIGAKRTAHRHIIRIDELRVPA